MDPYLRGMDGGCEDPYSLFHLNEDEGKRGRDRMSAGAWVMLVFGCVVLYGGLAWSLLRTRKGKKS